MPDTLEFFRWLQSTSLSALIRGSSWAFALIEMVHLLGLALLGGAVLIAALRGAGFVLAVQPFGVVVRGVLPQAITGLVILLASGIFLIADEPLRYYANAAFRAKLTLLAVAVAVSVPAYRRAAVLDGELAVSHALRGATFLSALLWFAVALAGRLIGLL